MPEMSQAATEMRYAAAGMQQKGKAECTFFDHALQQQLPRSYVHSLITRLDRLKSVQSAIGGPQYPPPNLTPRVQPSAPQFAHKISSSAAPSPADERTFDKHFVVQHANPTGWQYFGSSSFFALTVEVLVHARAKFGPVTHDENYAGPEFWFNRHVEGPAPDPRETPDRSTIERLVGLYMASPNLLQAFIDQDSIVHDIEGYLACHGADVRRLVSYQAHQYFRISMICAITCANKARHQSSYAAESMLYYAEALRCVEEVTSDVSVESLIALLLLILFAMFYPRKGDIWKLLDFACRLSVELGYHTEQEAGFADDKTRLRWRSIFWGLYAIERSIGQHFGRPSDLPEDIITTEYPANLNMISITDGAPFQSIAMSHYYRLVYLRSELSRELYLPAIKPDLPNFWYQQKFSMLLNWWQELPSYDNFAGAGSITCNIAYESSKCFLFQPLLMTALSHTADPTWANTQMDSVPAESYWSACQLIEIYSKIFQAPEDTPMGLYPVTILSAFHIQNAAMTIIAMCLVAVDGRVPITSWDPQKADASRESIRFTNIYETSDSCLLLLKKCAERWPGMIGLSDIFQNLSNKVVPMIMRGGLA